MKLRYCKFLRVFFLAILMIGARPAAADIRLPAFFGDNMVLQRNDDAPIWGISDPKTVVRITTSWDKKKYKVRSGSDGKWKVTVATPEAGGPYSISFNDGELLLKNILIGEVWVCSGQSNMEMSVSRARYKEKEIAAAHYPEIRLLQIENTSSTIPLNDVKPEGGGWLVCSPDVIADFSAVAYFFARNIYEHQKIPIGVIHTSWGGTRAEAWTSAISLKKMPGFKGAVEEMELLADNKAAQEKQYREQLDKWLAEFMENDPGYKNGSPVWANSVIDTSPWQAIDLPGFWEGKGLQNFDGSVWLRKPVNIPASWVGEELQLHLTAIDDNDITWFNGHEVGRTEGWDKHRVYRVADDLVKAGENVIVVRALDTGGNGGMHGESGQLYISNTAGERISVAGEWIYHVGVNRSSVGVKPKDINDPNRITVLFNAMVNPFIPFAIRGAIWYQGESNAAEAYQYRKLFPLMISDWREKWGRGDFPFYFVQLANYRAVKDYPDESDWAELREAQLMTLSAPNTGMAVAIDIGEANDIHPKNKQEVGRRLALIARAKIYEEDIAYSGPIYTSHAVDNNEIRLSFDQTSGGLVAANNQKLKGFAIAGADRRFYWADAKISGNEVVVSSPEVSHPVAVRYAWADNPVCNLYNGAGLPASPFRTDEWPGVTVDTNASSRK